MCKAENGGYGYFVCKRENGDYGDIVRKTDHHITNRQTPLKYCKYTAYVYNNNSLTQSRAITFEAGHAQRSVWFLSNTLSLSVK